MTFPLKSISLGVIDEKSSLECDYYATAYDYVNLLSLL